MALTKVSGGVLENGIDVAGIVTATGFDGPFTGGSSRNVTAGIGTFTGLDVNGNGDISGTLTVHQNATFNGNVSIAKTLTYEDVTNIDSVGIITARDAIILSEDNAIHFRGATDSDRDAILRASAGGGQLLINSRNDTILNIDSNGDSTDAHFAVAHGAATGSSTELLRVQEDGKVGIATNVVFNSALLSIGNGQGANIPTGEHIKIGPSANTITFLDSPSNTSDTGNIEFWNTVYNNSAAKIQFYHPAANTGGIKFLTQPAAGSTLIEALRINSTGQIGISTQTIPSDAAVHIGLDGAREYLRLDGDASNNNAYIELQADDNRRKAIIFKSGGTRRACLGVGDNDEGNATKLFLSANNSIGGDNAHLIIESGGQVGVKHQTPSSQYFNTLVVGDDSVGDKGITIRTTSNAKGVLAFSDTDSADANRYDGWIGYIHRDQRMVFNTGGANHAMSIDSSRNIGIGLTNPSEKLDVAGSIQCSGSLKLSTHPLVSYASFVLDSGDYAARLGSTGTSTIRHTQIYGGGSHIATFDGVNTRLGIGITNPSNALDVQGGTTNTAIVARSTDAKAQISLLDNTTTGVGCVVLGAEGDELFLTSGSAGAERLRIDASGRVAIGTATEGHSTADDLTIATSAHTGMTIRSGTSHEGNIFFSDGTSGAAEYQGIIRFDHNDDALKFNTTGSVRLTIDSDGKATFTEEIATPQDYPNYRPTVDFNFVAVKKLDPRFTYVRTGPASYIDHLGFVKLVGANVPRFDHDPDTGESKGLLVEETRINLIPWSFDGGNWSTGSGGNTVTRNAGTAPDGTETATKVLSANNDIDVNTQLGNAGPGLTGQIAISGGTTYTLSIWAKASTTAQVGNNFKVRWKRVQGDSTFAETTFALTANWVRYSATNTTAANNSTVACYVGGVSGSEALVWGAQFEAGAYTTSLIPTHGQSATRGDETVTMEGEEFTDFYNQEEGTIVLSASYTEDQRTSAIVTIDDTSNTSEYTEVGYRAGGSGSGKVGAYTRTDAGNDQYFKGFDNSATAGNEFKVAFGYKDNDYASSVNGATIHTDTSGTTSKVFDRLRFNHVDSVSPPIGSGHIRRFMYYPKKLPNGQVVTLTS